METEGFVTLVLLWGKTLGISQAKRKENEAKQRENEAKQRENEAKQRVKSEAKQN